MPTPLANDDERLADAIRGFGCPREAFVSLRNEQKKSPSHVPYLDLLSDQVQAEAKRLPDAVAEFQGKPVMYLLDSQAGEPDPEVRIELQQRLANRGDHAFLAVVRPGELVLYPLNLDRETLNKKGVGRTFRIADPRAPFLFHEIASGTLPEVEGQATEADPVFEEIKKLLDKAVDELVIAGGLDGLDARSSSAS